MEREPLDWVMRTGRRPVSHVGTIRLRDGSEMRAVVTNLSFEGCQLVSENELLVGDVIVLAIPGRGTIEGQVRWQADGRSGIRFVLGNSAGEARRLRIGV